VGPSCAKRCGLWTAGCAKDGHVEPWIPREQIHPPARSWSITIVPTCSNLVMVWETWETWEYVWETRFGDNHCFVIQFMVWDTWEHHLQYTLVDPRSWGISQGPRIGENNQG